MIVRTLAAFTVLGFFISAAVSADDAPLDPRTIWAGVYTEEQANLGERIYPSVCGRCHGWRLDGAPDDPDMFPTPPIAGAKFLRNWNGGSLASLFEYTRTMMPELNPGSLSNQEFAAVVAYMLAVSGTPAGLTELPTDLAVLAGITVEPAP